MINNKFQTLISKETLQWVNELKQENKVKGKLPQESPKIIDLKIRLKTKIEEISVQTNTMDIRTKKFKLTRIDHNIHSTKTLLSTNIVFCKITRINPNFVKNPKSIPPKNPENQEKIKTSSLISTITK